MTYHDMFFCCFVFGFALYQWEKYYGVLLQLFKHDWMSNLPSNRINKTVMDHVTQRQSWRLSDIPGQIDIDEVINLLIE